MSALELLDAIHGKGLAAAQTHFDELVACMRSVLPDGVNGTIPKTLEDVGSLFSASTVEFYLVILPDTTGYACMSAVFEYKPNSWGFKKFSVMIGGGGLFVPTKEYTATCIEDALVLSRQIAKYREKYEAENPAIPSFPDMTTSRPN